MAKTDTALIDKLRLTEQGSNPASPASGYGYLFCKSDGLYFKDDGGNVYGPMGSATGSGAIPNSGWIDDTAHTWTYASATSFTIAGVDLTATFTKGTKLKWTQTTVKYGVVASSSFSTNTTVNLIATSDYSVANAAISANYYSYIENPQGFPHAFNWTVTFTGFSADPTNLVNRWTVRGNRITLTIRCGANGTSNATTYTVSLPVNAATITNMAWFGHLRVADNSAAQSTPGLAIISSAGSVIDIYKTTAAGAFTNSGGKAANGEVSYEF